MSAQAPLTHAQAFGHEPASDACKAHDHRTHVPTAPDVPVPARVDPSWVDVEPAKVWPGELVRFVQSHATVDGLLRHAALAEQLGEATNDRYPRLVRHAGALWVVDGTHRVLIAVIRGTAFMARIRNWPF